MLANQHKYVFNLGKKPHKTENTTLNEDQVWLVSSLTVSRFVLCSCLLVPAQLCLCEQHIHFIIT